ncbi:MAG: hypothetical protein V2J25_11950 [Desulfatiglans sp.]|jgi:hypothetical protein|nr:hypothetical protein [Thermodesulfobacteriota bacterium]MEE4353572.1 hypothetical protein [Desulfatiglans sp.]
MQWDLFIGRKKSRPAKQKDDFDRLIDAIESFAPKKHLGKREAFYYNYRTIGPYKKPLLLLLQTISENRGALPEETSCAKDLFDQLKAFYDLKDRLSPEDAVKDWGLIRKYRELFQFFYNINDISTEELLSWVGKAD